MIHFIKTKQNKTIIECEVAKQDLSAVVNIYNYSMELGQMGHRSMEYIVDFDTLSKIRSTFWEQVPKPSNTPPEKDAIEEFVKLKFIDICKKYGYLYKAD